MDRSSGSHHHFVNEGKTISVPVHGGRDIGRGLLRAIIKQATISHEEFLELVGINN